MRWACFRQLDSMYRSEATFAATQIVWDLYRKYHDNPSGAPITRKQALEFVHETDKQSVRVEGSS